MENTTVSEFRRNLFSFLEAALKGEQVQFVHKGVKFRVVPETQIDKLANLTPLQIINPACPDLESADKELMDEMQAEWKKDWNTL